MREKKAGRLRLPLQLRVAGTLVGAGLVFLSVGAGVGAVSDFRCGLEHRCGESAHAADALLVSRAAPTPIFVSVLSNVPIGSVTAVTASPAPAVTSPDARMVLINVITGHLDPKSVVASGTGLFFAQNMMYLHTINVYGRDLKLLKIIPDTVDLAALGYHRFHGTYRGAPVEAAFTPDGESVYVSNYSMYGPKPFTHEGSDDCMLSDHIPNSFVYRINLASLTIDQAIEVGAVPKFIAVTPNGKLLLVSNWCSYSESIVDVKTGRQLRQIPVGAFPRGIAVSPTSTIAYVAVMGSTRIAVIDLLNFTVSWIEDVGSAPRHLVISPDGRWLYATINGDGIVDKIDLASRKVVGRVFTGRAPRSMAISSDGGSLYVVNYKSNTLSKVRASDMHVLQVLKTNEAPIGITYDALTRRVLVACYSGSIMVFSDQIRKKRGTLAAPSPSAPAALAQPTPAPGPPGTTTPSPTPGTSGTQASPSASALPSSPQPTPTATPELPATPSPVALPRP